MEEEKLTFPDKLVKMIQAQSYEQLVFILVVGVVISLSVMGFVFFMTRNQKSPHES